MSKKDAIFGKLIIFEGPDGVGKSTISRKVYKRLLDAGAKCELLTFPGREEGTLGHLVYRIHHHPEQVGLNALTASSVQALHIAAHLDVIERRIVPALSQGTTVLLDRYWWSTWLYGLVAGMKPELLRSMIDLECQQWGDIVPTIAVLIRREMPIDRDEPIAYWRDLRLEYDRLAEREKQKYPVRVLDNNATLESSVDAILRSIKEMTAIDSRSMTVQSELEMELSRPTQKNLGAHQVASHISPIQPTAVFDTFWRFACERQRIFFKRLAGAPWPWTEDPVLSTYRFTNPYRVSDRTSQYLIRRVIYRDDLPLTEREVFFRIMLFKMFNTIDTWELLEKSFGPITFEDFSRERFDQILSDAIASGKKIYSGAYIMPPGNTSFGHQKKHRNHLALIELMMSKDLPERLTDAKNMQEGFELLLACPMIGEFLAYQLIVDINYSEIINFTETEFVVPGPGARDGIQKCFYDRGGLNEPEIIKFMADREDQEFDRLGLQFQSLWGRRLQLVDYQNLFCEVDKYARVRHPDVRGSTRRTRIKRKYSPTEAPLERPSSSIRTIRTLTRRSWVRT